jgi:hypothetical protein
MARLKASSLISSLSAILLKPGQIGTRKESQSGFAVGQQSIEGTQSHFASFAVNRIDAQARSANKACEDGRDMDGFESISTKLLPVAPASYPA